MEIKTFEAAKAAGLNISECAEQGILSALGTDTTSKNDIDPIGAYIAALDVTDRDQITQAILTGVYREPGIFGKKRKCPDPGRRLHAILVRKYRFKHVDGDVIQVILNRLVPPKAVA